MIDTTKTIDTQITLPIELNEEIVRRARECGHSINGEIVSLLTPALMPISTELERELADWEAASDEDWLIIDKL